MVKLCPDKEKLCLREELSQWGSDVSCFMLFKNFNLEYFLHINLNVDINFLRLCSYKIVGATLISHRHANRPWVQAIPKHKHTPLCGVYWLAFLSWAFLEATAGLIIRWLPFQYDHFHSFRIHRSSFLMNSFLCLSECYMISTIWKKFQKQIGPKLSCAKLSF